MILGEHTQRSLRDWIQTDTWHTGHPLDDRRFFLFIDAFYAEHGGTIGDVGMIDVIRQGVSEQTSPAPFEKTIYRYGLLGANILEFLHTTGASRGSAADENEEL